MANVEFAKIMQTNEELTFIYNLVHLWGFFLKYVSKFLYV
jgi:hypothetical protein